MKTQLSSMLSLKYEPVATIWTNQKPEHTIEFKPGRWGCVMRWFVSAAKGKTAVFSRQTYGCWGGGVGLGFGNLYKEFPGGEECFHGFLSTGNRGDHTGEAVAEKIKDFISPSFLQDFMDGEGYLSSPEEVRNFIQKLLPIRDIPYDYVVFKPLSQVDLQVEQPKVVSFLVRPPQLSALIVLAHFRNNTTPRVIAPFSAGCQNIGIWAYADDNDENAKAVIGLTDISARLNVKHQISDDYLTISFPWRMFLELEKNAPKSFLTKSSWKELVAEGNKGK
ncbi:MAG TPA: DUF169 domain-containing protein [Candidatus Hydrogenedens sp.]|nr:DUF169 domain-containing protein [Candidatus Hydrogenedens sp.]